MEISYSEEIMYHISDLKKYNRCPRIYLLDQTVETPPFRRIIRLDDEVTPLAAEYLGIKESFVGERGDDPARAMEALGSHEWLLKARFEYGGLRIKVPFLHRMPDGTFDLLFLLLGLFPRSTDIQYFCDTVWVLEHLGITIGDIRIIHLNADYVRGDELDCSQLFVTSDRFYNNKNHPSVLVKEKIYAEMKDVSVQIAQLDQAVRTPMEPPVRMSRCSGRQKCRHYDRCFEEESRLPADSILTLSGGSKRYQMKTEGIEYLKDADLSRVEGSPVQYAQIMADRLGGMFADRNALSGWLQDIVYPVTFLDFEWECFPIPPYKGMKPFDVLLFEYSLHILEQNGSWENKVFLSVHDERRALAEQLIRDIPDQGSIIAYNADGAEKIRIAELAEQFPDCAEELHGLNSRMKDLQIPFASGYVYDVRMRGSWTLKQIMSMMDEPGYHELDIQQGMDAVFQWRQLDREEKNADRERIIEELKAYCGMDSYAAMVVFQWLQSLVKSEE